MEVIKLSDEEGKRWGEAVKPLLDGYVKKTEAAGLPGAEALKAAQEAVEKFK